MLDFSRFYVTGFMKYTRYNYKKKNDKGFKSLTFFITIVILAVILGTILSKFIFKGDFSIEDIIGTKDKPSNNETQVTDSKVYGTFELIQCGYYSEEKYALETQKKLSGTIPVYLIKDGDKYRVISGIYMLDKGDEDKNKIISLGTQAVRLKIDIQGKSYYDSFIYGLVDGYMKMLDGLKDSSVKSVTTEKFKTWVSDIEEKEDRASEIKAIKEHVNNLPAEITRDNISGELEFLYSLIGPYKSS